MEEVSSGANDTKYMTPSKTKSAIQTFGKNIGEVQFCMYDLEAESNGMYLQCDGRKVSKNDYPDLIDIIQPTNGMEESYVMLPPQTGTSASNTCCAISDDKNTYCVCKSNGDVYVYGGGYNYVTGVQSGGGEILVGYVNGFFYVVSTLLSSNDNVGAVYKIDYKNKKTEQIKSLASGWASTGNNGIGFKYNSSLYFVAVFGSRTHVIIINSSGVTTIIDIPDSQRNSSFFVIGNYLYVCVAVSNIYKWVRAVIGTWSFVDYTNSKLPPYNGASGYYTLQCSSIGDNREWAYVRENDPNSTAKLIAYFIDIDMNIYNVKFTSKNAKISFPSPNNFLDSFVSKIDGKYIMRCRNSLATFVPNGQDLTIDFSKPYTTVGGTNYPMAIGDVSKFVIGNSSPYPYMYFDNIDTSYLTAFPMASYLKSTSFGDYYVPIAYVKAK